ncbi:MAG TPA: hypothetical protein PKZ24_05855 [Nitrospirales bacterium]|nr:hypothetical protein [Nitrospirales bacterium]
MAVPQDNRFFQRGGFEGFTTYGLCQIVTSFEAYRGVHTFHPVRGEFFAVLDDPRKIDGDGARKKTSRGPKPADTSYLSLSVDSDGRTTVGADGAMLECANVKIDAGKSLWFHWAFSRFDWSPGNDFAVFEAYDGNGTHGSPVYRQLLTQSLDLEKTSQWYSDWRVCAWRPDTNFSGTLRWVVSNGLSTSTGLPRPGGAARPSALLIDCVEID